VALQQYSAENISRQGTPRKNEKRTEDHSICNAKSCGAGIQQTSWCPYIFLMLRKTIALVCHGRQHLKQSM
jgi:hypothetical protein